jgi:endonuclease/exonuclease/phosphatase (EEP) superfamily protein YafD
LLKHTALAITPEGVVVSDTAGQQHVLPADTIVSAIGLRPLRGKANELRQAAAANAANVIAVGDCNHPRSMSEAVKEGFFAGYAI